MVHATVVPDGQIIGVLPSMADLEIMVLHDQGKEPVQRMLALLLTKLIDLRHVVAYTKDGFPAGYRVCANNWMDGFQLGPYVLWRTSRFAVQFEVVILRGGTKPRLCVGCCEPLEELLVWRR